MTQANRVNPYFGICLNEYCHLFDTPYRIGRPAWAKYIHVPSIEVQYPRGVRNMCLFWYLQYL